MIFICRWLFLTIIHAVSKSRWPNKVTRPAAAIKSLRFACFYLTLRLLLICVSLYIFSKSVKPSDCTIFHIFLGASGALNFYEYTDWLASWTRPAVGFHPLDSIFYVPSCAIEWFGTGSAISFVYGTIGSSKNDIIVMLIYHFEWCLCLHVQLQHFLQVLWPCRVMARWPYLVSSMTHLSVHSLVHAIQSTGDSFFVHVIGSKATVVRTVSEATELKLNKFN